MIVFVDQFASFAALKDMKHLIVVHLLVCLFGSGAWVAVNGVWVELPVIVFQSPEQWDLPSYLAVITQLANIGPIVVTIIQICKASCYNPITTIYAILGIGTISTLLLSIFSRATVYIEGSNISLALFILYFALACVDCTSSVTFLPFMGNLDRRFITTYFIGEGLSGVFPSIVALLQGVGKTSCVEKSVTNSTTNATSKSLLTIYESPRFSESVFFGTLFVLMLVCSVSFLLLNNLPAAKKFHVANLQNTPECKNETEMQNLYENSSADQQSDHIKSNTNSEDGEDEFEQLNTSPPLTGRNYAFLLLTVMWINLITNGAYPSVSSYVCIPYGETAYHVSSVIGTLSNPLACFVSVFLSTNSFKTIGILTAVGTGTGSYLFYIATMSPCPPLVGSVGGSAVMVIAVGAFIGMLSYVKVTIGQVFRNRGNPKSLLFYGAVVQAGSFIGALATFLLVKYTTYFEAGDPCTTVC